MNKLLLLIFLPLTAFTNDCDSLHQTRTRLNISAFNFLNANTTRTEEGGPYLARKIIKCSKRKCEIQKANKEYDTFLKYQPNHPDSNKAGYVRYPDINKKEELATVNSRAHHLVLLAEKGACKTNINKTKNHTFYELSYGQEELAAGLAKVKTSIAYKVKPISAYVKSDKLLFSEGKLKSWEVEYRDGTTTITSF